MNKKNWLLIILACVVTFSTYSCKSKDNDDDADVAVEWTKVSAFDGGSRAGAVSFLINNIAYVTTGTATEANMAVRKKDTWAYSATAGTWSQKAEFPGVAREQAVAFAIGNTGYVGAGTDGTNALTDFYKYTVATNTWDKIADIPGKGRYGAVAFTIGGQGYVATGSDGNANFTDVKSIYKYDPATNAWTPVENKFKTTMRNAFAFVINDIAYIGGGFDSGSNSYPTELYKYDGKNWDDLPSLNNTDLGYDISRSNAATFVLNNFGYVVGGTKNGGIMLNTIFKFNPSTKLWTSDNQVFQGDARKDAVGFGIDNVGYVTTGQNGSKKLNDTWKFVPVK